jgi:hypothetical protein
MQYRPMFLENVFENFCGLGLYYLTKSTCKKRILKGRILFYVRFYRLCIYRKDSESKSAFAGTYIHYCIGVYKYNDTYF